MKSSLNPENLKAFLISISLLLIAPQQANAERWLLLSTTKLPPSHELWKKYQVKIDTNSIKRNGHLVEFYYTIDFDGHDPKDTFSIGKTKLNVYDCISGKMKHPETETWMTPDKAFIGAIAQKFACNW